MGLGKFDVKKLAGLTQDSRAVKRGFLFAALPGSKMDGRKFIEDAIRNGASAILAPTGAMLPDGTDDVELITDDNPRRKLALLAAEFYGNQPGFIAAVTGTNGKTSTVHFARDLWKLRGLKAASIGTLGVRMGDTVRSGSLTTPDPVSLQAELADLAAVKVTHLVMEASSIGLHQHRVGQPGLHRLDAAGEGAGVAVAAGDHVPEQRHVAGQPRIWHCATCQG